jgi:AraC family transcriptional regulator, regulatory protein of adaptative response / DNA-3-methyladenine glycosylase II
VVDHFETCYRRIEARDARYDGVFFSAVTSTRVYCRPSCAARLPKRQNVRFYATAAEAEAAGFRPCKRCRPDAGPDSLEWNRRAHLVERACVLIRTSSTNRRAVADIAAELGLSERHLRRLVVQSLGMSPRSLSRAERARNAKDMIEGSGRPFTEIAYASGFGSVRQFNHTIRQLFDATPTQLRDIARRTNAKLVDGSQLSSP